VAETLNILTKNPEVWSKTIFILTYDENDGYFDHVPPFVAPEPGNAQSGKTSAGLDAALEYLPLEQDLKRQPAKAARGGPVGLGFRVPLLVVSPWSRGGYVCSEVFDHTSVVRLLEGVLSRQSGREIRETNITAWRRAMCGDLTNAFRPFDGGSAKVDFPARDSFFERVHRAQFAGMPNGYRRLSEEDAASFAKDRSQLPGCRSRSPAYGLRRLCRMSWRRAAR
jgi:phospholipase C